LFDLFLDYIKKLFKSRLFPITLIYLVLFGAVIHRLFVLQIVDGQEIIEQNELMNTKEREIESTRGNIYDCNGKLLASNELTYAVVMEDSTQIKSNEVRNAIIDQLIKIIEGNGDTLDNEFFIVQNEKNDLEFTITDTELTRFKKKVYAYVLDHGELTETQKEATAQDVYEFLKSGKGYEKQTTMFGISDSYSVEETLKIMSVRYALFCNYPKYLQITVASNISKETIAGIEEESAELTGVEVKQQTHRVYENSVCFSNIIGYTGLISSTELDSYNAEDDIYNSTDIVGKTGLEKIYEDVLRGTKGVETVSVTTSDRVIDTLYRTDPIAGNDIYLTIDSDLQVAAYNLLEKELSNILLENITSDMNYGSKGESASDIKIPIYDVYYALINNNIININQLNDDDATALEQQTYQKYENKMEDIFHQLDTYLSINNTITNNKAGDIEDYLDYFYSVLSDNKLLLTDNIPKGDSSLTDYKDDKISLNNFLMSALSNNWIDLSVLEVGDQYYSTEELYDKLITYTKENLLKKDSKFKKMIYRSLVFSYNLTGSEICLLLFDQGVLKYNESEVNKLKNGGISSFTFLTNKIKSLEITPGMLALTPCRGSVIITDVKTGDVRALVSYPGYDNNKFAGKIDSQYYKQVYNDLTTPMVNKATSETVAPGSTFKMVTSVASLEEGVITTDNEIYDLGEFTKINPSPKCHIYPGTHGSVNIMDALAVSCNYFFFEMGWRLSINSLGKYDSDQGLATLRKYASLFGLDEKSGIGLSESSPKISDYDAVRSAIGQGSNVYAPVQLARYVTTLANRGTCYDLNLLDKIMTNDNQLIKDNSATINHTLDSVKESTWNAVQEGMYDVVNTSKGSVYTTFKDLNVVVAGKTGTSQISKSVPNNALFVSFAPYNNPEISVTAVIPNGFTSHNAALLARNIYALYYGQEDEATLLQDDGTNAGNTSTLE